MSRAQTRLAQLYLAGAGVPQDPAVAAEWLRRGAEAGDAEAETLLAGLHLSGTAVERDPADGGAAAAPGGRARLRAGDAAARPFLRRRTAAPAPNQEEAVRWYRAAAEAGVVAAQWIVAQNTFIGAWGPRDPEEAAAWFRRAAEAGHAGAQLQLGVMYCTADGVPRDLAEGTAWYRRAAEQGERIAQYNFAVMLFRGDGVTRDIEAAHRVVPQGGRAGHARGADRAGRRLCHRDRRAGRCSRRRPAGMKRPRPRGIPRRRQSSPACARPRLVAQAEPLQVRMAAGTPPGR